MREPTAAQLAKAHRLLDERAVRIAQTGGDTCTAQVRGDSGSYEVTARGTWFTCTCPVQSFNPSHKCSHIAATELAWDTVRDVREADANGE